MEEKIGKLYEFFYVLVSGNRFYEFNPTEVQKKTIQNFIVMLPIGVGDEWLFEYFCFSFAKRETQKTRFGKGKVMLNWVVGKKSLRTYMEATEEEKYWGEEFRLRHKLTNPLFTYTKIIPSSDYKNKERLRFYNTDAGLLHCLEMNLFEENNKNCLFCINRKFCKNGKCT